MFYLYRRKTTKETEIRKNGIPKNLNKRYSEAYFATWSSLAKKLAIEDAKNTPINATTIPMVKEIMSELFNVFPHSK